LDVDRFFSKLDLRDIKIDPFKTSYPPDAEEDEASVAELVEVESYEPAPLGARRPHTPAWATAEPELEPEPEVGNGYDAAAGYDPGNGYGAEAGYDEPGNTYDEADEGYPNGGIAAAPAVATVERRNGDVLKVSARSRPSAVAGAIAGVVRENGRAEVQAIGAGATNQAVKAVAIARDYLRETGIEAVCLPAFIDVTIDNEDRTAIRLVVEPR
jgi:stage V sporulation protein S